MNSGPLAASRTALVATTTVVSGPWAAASCASSCTAATPRAMPSAARRGGFWPMPALMRASIVRMRRATRRPPGAGAATSTLMELLPISMTAMEGTAGRTEWRL